MIIFKIKDGSNPDDKELARICGSEIPTAIYKSTGDAMSLKFRSVYSNGDKGFNVRYHAGKKQCLL